MCEPSGNVIVEICSWSADWFLVVSGLQEAYRAPIASHLLASSRNPVYVLKRWSFLSYIFKSRMLPVVMLMSFA
jgi:hypothetical protein